MARRRYVSTTISQDTRVNRLAIKCGDFSALLYTWMIPHAADDATLPGDPEELLYQILPGRRDKTEADVQQALDGMAALGLIIGTDDGRIMFPPTAFYKYQTYIKERNKHGGNDTPEPAQDSATPPPAQSTQTDSAEQRKSAQNTVSFSPSFSVSPSLSHSPLVTPPMSPEPESESAPALAATPPTDAPPAKTKSSKQHEQTFEHFWRVWPQKVGKAKALAAWLKLRLDPETVQFILDTVPRHHAIRDWSRENWRYCPNPATWLNERRWEDELPDNVPRLRAVGSEEGLIGKDRERVEVARRVMARRGYGPDGVDANPATSGGGIPRLVDRTGA